MKLLFISMTPIYYNSSAIIRMCGYISGAAKLGHICDLVTLEANRDDFLYDSSNEALVNQYIRNYYTFQKTGIYEKISEKNKSCIVKKRLKSIARKMYYAWNVYDPQQMNIVKILDLPIDYNQYDRIITISDPKSGHKLVAELERSGKVSGVKDKWIQCWGDPWLLDMTKSYGIKKIKIRKEEENLLSKAGRIIYTNPFTLKAQKSLYPKMAESMYYVGQCTFDVKNESTSNEKSVGYFGSYESNVRNILPLYQTCKEHGYKLRIAGRSDLNLEAADNIEIYGNKSLSEVNELELKTGVIISICNIRGTQIPGKIFYQAGYRKPMIVVVDGENKNEMRKYFESFHRYIICENNKNAINNAIKRAFYEIEENREYQMDERFDDRYCAGMVLGDDEKIV